MMNSLLISDAYKQSHRVQYPEGTEMVYSNWTPRSNKYSKSSNGVVVFGVQAFLKKITKWFDKGFFQLPKEKVVKEFSEGYKNYFNEIPDTKHVEDLHDLGYLPVVIKSLPEGTVCPIGVPILTIRNTIPEFYWMPNFLETIMSTELWLPMTSATIAREYLKIVTKWSNLTCDDNSHIPFQCHDFSMRGMSGLEAAMASGAGHLLSFVGTDTIPAVYYLKEFYNADPSKEMVGVSIPATEHSVMSMGTKEDELGTFKRLITKVYPKGFVSIVSDTWDLWKVCTEYLPQLKEDILARDGRVVIRPDSGDPVDIICGKSDGVYRFDSKDKLYDFLQDCEQNEGDIIEWEGKYYEIGDVESFIREYGEDTWSELVSTRSRFSDLIDGGRIGILIPVTAPEIKDSERKGVIKLLWDTFGGTINKKGYKLLDPHIGAIYGDSITLERADQICARLQAKGFASSNIVFGVGSYTYQYNTRDTYGFAMKATFGIVNDECRVIYKDPVTDDGMKKSLKGLLVVHKIDNKLVVKDNCSLEEESFGELKMVYENGKLINTTNLNTIRNLIKANNEM